MYNMKNIIHHTENMARYNIEEISYGLSSYRYHGNFQATEELIDLFNKISKKPLETTEDYIIFYDDHFYTYPTWEAFIQDEIRQNNGMTEEKCKEQVNKTIWKLPCEWIVQYV